MEEYAYFTLRIRMQDGDRIDGVVERLGTGERRNFEGDEQLQERLTELLHRSNMRSTGAHDKEQSVVPTPADEPAPTSSPNRREP